MSTLPPARCGPQAHSAEVVSRPRPRLSLLELAQREGVSISELNFLLDHAKEDLFGRKLSERAIYYLLEKRRQGKGGTALPPTRCAEEGCRQYLPHNACAHKRFCTEHATPAARVRRHRRRREYRSQ